MVFKRLILSTATIGFVAATVAAKGAVGLDVFERLRVVHDIKRPPGPQDWLAVHPEPGQTVSDFVKQTPSKPQPGQVIIVQPIGAFDAVRFRILGETVEVMRAFFYMPVRIAEVLPLDDIPAYARRVFDQTGQRQILTTYLLDHVLIPQRPDDAFCVLGLTAEDLWPGEGWNFVFGQADIVERVGVWSLARNGDPSLSQEMFDTVLRRTVATALHETGHLFGLWHCPFYECLMNGSNHRKESDQRPLWLCPIDLRKLQILLGWDLKQRFHDLKVVYEKLGWRKEVEFYQKCLDLLESGPDE